MSAEDLGGYVRLLLGGTDVNSLPLVTIPPPSTGQTQTLYAFGLSTSVTQDADGNWSASQTDPSGRTVWSVAPDGGVTQTLYGIGGTSVPNHFVQGVSGGGYQQTAIDPLGNATDSIYNVAGQLMDEYQPPVTVGSDTVDFVRPHWQYVYDVNGNLSQKLTPDNQGGPPTISLYDPLGNEVSRTMPDGTHTETWVYDQLGRLNQSTDYDGNTQTDSYYPSGPDTGMLHTVTYAGPGKTTETVGYTYDALGRKATVTDSSDGTTTYTYDPVTGSVASVTSPQGTVNHVYDPATGRLVETWTGTHHASATTDTLDGYNLLGQLASVTTLKAAGVMLAAPMTQYAGFDATGGAVPTSAPTTLYLYDGDGKLTKQLNPNGTEQDTVYSAVADQQTVTNKITGSGQTLSSYFYQEDLGGRKTSDVETRLNNDGASYTITNIGWQYDAISRLAQETYSDGVAADNYTDAYTYDLDGNRLQKIHTSGVPANNQSIGYAYNADDQLTTEQTDNVFTTNAALQYSTIYGYDNNGSMISATRTGAGAENDTYTYDARSRLVGATVGGVTSAYTYNDEGDRTSQTTGSATTTYLVDGHNPSGYVQVLEEHNGSSVTTNVSGSQGVIAQVVSGTVTYLLMDGHGSTRLLTSATGQVVGEYDYDAFGNVLTPSSGAKAWANALSTPYEFAGMRSDQLLRMQLTESRPYTPSLGRFQMADSYIARPGDSDNANLYIYVGNHPTYSQDPSGHFTTTEALVTLGIIGVAFGGILFGYHEYYVPSRVGGTRLVAVATQSLSSALYTNVSAGDTNMSAFVSSIASKQGKAPLTDLVVISHGAPGLIQFSDNPRIVRPFTPNSADPRIIYDTGNANTPVIQLAGTAAVFGQQLRTQIHFAPNARIVLNVCESAGTLSGIANMPNLPQIIADSSGVTVYAPIDYVHGDTCLYPANEAANLPIQFRKYQPRTPATQQVP